MTKFKPGDLITQSRRNCWLIESVSFRVLSKKPCYTLTVLGPEYGITVTLDTYSIDNEFQIVTDMFRIDTLDK